MEPVVACVALTLLKPDIHHGRYEIILLNLLTYRSAELQSIYIQTEGMKADTSVHFSSSFANQL